MEIYEGLLMLQHRGQDSAGMVTTDGHRFREHKDNGLVREVFGQQRTLDSLSGASRRSSNFRSRATGNYKLEISSCLISPQLSYHFRC